LVLIKKGKRQKQISPPQKGGDFLRKKQKDSRTKANRIKGNRAKATETKRAKDHRPGIIPEYVRQNGTKAGDKKLLCLAPGL
jgi:hypothetical protein